MVGLAATGGVAAMAAPASAAPAPISTTVLSDSMQSVLSLPHVTHLGALATDRHMTVGVWIPGATSALEAYATEVGTPGSPVYGQTLTPAQVEARFGVSQLVSGEVRHLLEADGLRAEYVSADGEYLELSGSAAQVEQTFKVDLQQVSAGGRTFFANTNGATVPSPVGAVLGLTDLTDMTPAVTQTGCGTVPGQCIGTVYPGTVREPYDLPAGDLGQGQKVAVFGEGDLSHVVASLRANEAATSLDPIGTGALSKPAQPQVPVREVLVGDPQGPNADTAGQDEWDLDSQSITDMAPDLSELDFYFGADLTDQAIAGTYSAWVNDANGPAIGNSSFGGCEALEELSGGVPTLDALLAGAVAEGRTMFSSTGDGGAGCQFLANAGQPGVVGANSPSTSRFAVAVGGTELDTTATTAGAQAQPPTRALEIGWHNGGGGYSEFDGMLPGQQAVVAPNATAVPTPLRASTCTTDAGPGTCREVPDVAALSGDLANDSVDIVECTTASSTGCGELQGAGTSVSSPLWAGMWSLVRAAHPTSANACTSPVGDADAAKADLGFAQADLYDLAAKDDSAFFDVGGTTNSAPSSNYYYTTLPKGTPSDATGFDLVTGLGSPDLGKIVADLDCGTSAVPAYTPVPAGSVTSYGGSSNPTQSCPSGYVATDPQNDVVPAADPDAPGVDLKDASVTANATSVTFTVDTYGTPVPAADDAFAVLFSYAGQIYGVDVDPQGLAGYGEVSTSGAAPPAGVLQRLFYLGPVAVPAVGTVAFAPTYLGALTGTVATATAPAHYTITLPFTTFDTDAAGVPGYQPLDATSTFAQVEVLSGHEPAFAATAAQQVSSDTLNFPCGAAVFTVGPLADLPDSKLPAGMVGVGVLTAGYVLVRVRRHRRS